MPLLGLSLTMKGFTDGIDAFEKEAIEAMKEAARTATREMMNRTPVWEGTTVRNYAWGVGGLPGGGQQAPDAGMTPGPTGSMGAPPAGEPRRGANEAAATAEMETVLAGYDDLHETLVCTNFSDIWDLVDNGSAPTPERARNPGGVSIMAVQATKARMGGKFK